MEGSIIQYKVDYDKQKHGCAFKEAERFNPHNGSSYTFRYVEVEAIFLAWTVEDGNTRAIIQYLDEPLSVSLSRIRFN